MFELCFNAKPRLMAGIVLLVLGALGLAGCATTRPVQPMDLSDPGWTIRNGQAVWTPKPGAAGMAGELMVAMHSDGRSFVQFVKTPLPIASAQLTTNSWRVTLGTENKTYAGKGAPPERILWLQFPDGLVGRHSSTNWYFARTKEDGWHFENLQTEEALDGFLSTTRLPRLHVVKDGETVNRIARIYGITTPALRGANPGAGADWLRAGNILQLPEPPKP